ncbi:MAG: hypothetical protein ACYCV6_01405 [Steroidobacteraceae bacterium]
MASYIQTNDGISVFVDGSLKSVSRDSLAYPQVVAAIQRGATPEEIKGLMASDLDKVTDAVEALKDQRITDDVAIEGGTVTFKGEAVHNTLTARMLRQIREGFDLKPMARFLENLMQNPSYRAVQDLYSFLEYGKMPITEDGCFLAYKKVRSDYRDIRTGTFDNSVGQVVSMPRNQVDEEPDRTCSHGLHVCSFDYLASYASASDDRVVISKVNPRDVVAIPTDYHNTKMRVSRYEVVGELESYQEERRNRLAEREIATPEFAFELRIGGGALEGTEGRETLREAAERAEELMECDHVEYVTIVNKTTGVQVEHYSTPSFLGYEEEDEDDEPAETAPVVSDPVLPAVNPYRVYLGGDKPEHIHGAFSKFDMAMRYATLLYSEHTGQPIFVMGDGKTLAVIGG